jgi:hypothetical protein
MDDSWSRPSTVKLADIVAYLADARKKCKMVAGRIAAGVWISCEVVRNCPRSPLNLGLQSFSIAAQETPLARAVEGELAQ